MIIACSKEQGKTKVIKNISDLNELFHLKNYKTQVRLKVNDSIDHITAQWHNFTLTGDFDTKMNNRTGIWTLKNSTNSKEILIDYLIFDKKDVFKNQIIFKEYNKIDSSVSKFYVKQKTAKELVMNFFSPKVKDEIYKEAKIRYLILRNSKEIKKDSIIYKNMKMKEGKYLINIKYDFKKDDIVKGYFGETVLLNGKNKDSIVMGDNTIYFIERF